MELDKQFAISPSELYKKCLPLETSSINNLLRAKHQLWRQSMETKQTECSPNTSASKIAQIKTGPDTITCDPKLINDQYMKYYLNFYLYLEATVNLMQSRKVLGPDEFNKPHLL